MEASLFPYVTALLPPAVLVVAIIRLLARTNIYLLTRRRIDPESGVHYVLAVHNASEVPLQGRITITVRVVLKDGRIEPDPTLLCGPQVQDLEIQMAEDHRSFQVITPRLRAQSTWVIHCPVNGQEGDVQLEVLHEKKLSDEEQYRKSGRWVQLGSDPATPTARGSWKWLVGGTLLALLTYLLPIHFLLSRPWQVQTWKPQLDGALVGVLLICSALAFWMCKPRPGPIILGHLGWERSTDQNGQPPARPPPSS